MEISKNLKIGNYCYLNSTIYGPCVVIIKDFMTLNTFGSKGILVEYIDFYDQIRQKTMKGVSEILQEDLSNSGILYKISSNINNIDYDTLNLLYTK